MRSYSMTFTYKPQNTNVTVKTFKDYLTRMINSSKAILIPNLWEKVQNNTQMYISEEGWEDLIYPVVDPKIVRRTCS